MVLYVTISVLVAVDTDDYPHYADTDASEISIPTAVQCAIQSAVSAIGEITTADRISCPVSIEDVLIEDIEE